jgi:tripartite-type tricarboxylate transporter receptor subunit TctC
MRRPTAKFLPMLFAAAIFMPLTAVAADWKPKGTMTVIVTSGAGGAYDVLARAMGKHWVKYFGVKVIVKNIKGAGGTLGMDRVAHSKPNGQVIGFTSRSPYLTELIKRSFPWKIEDIPVIIAATTPRYAFTVSTKSPFKTWDDIRKANRKIRIGIASRLTTELTIISDLTKHGREVATGSMKTAELITSVIAGDIDIWNVVTSKTFEDVWRAGDVTPLVFLSDKRDPRFPNVPTHIELGMERDWMAFQSIRMWFTAIGTPKPVINSIANRITKLLNDPGIKDWANKSGFVKGLIPGEQAKNAQAAAVNMIKKNWDLYKKYGG